MLVALVALFAALGGVGWAATQLPPNSVGTKQLRGQAVTYNKIALHTVGAQRINQNQVQTRVAGLCAGTKAVAQIQRSGGVSCASTVPAEFGASASSVSVGSSSTTITSKALPAGSNYLALANPSALITSAGPAQHVTVKCTLSVGSASQTRSLTVATDTAATQLEESIPLQLAGGPGTASLACSRSTAGGPATASPVAVTAAINAIQTSGNG
jgi:acyl-homoserine lactone acylase PvdQ